MLKSIKTFLANTVTKPFIFSTVGFVWRAVLQHRWSSGGLYPPPPNTLLELENKKRLENPIYLDRFEYKVYSQNGEDGIIAEIFNRIGTTDKRFVEFGVQNGLESNCHYLLFNGWSGLWIEGSKKYAKKINELFDKPIAGRRLSVVNAFITKDNIDELIGVQGGINGELDLLSIDIDGNDYHVWKAITCVNPRVVIIEYNIKFPPPCEWIMPYNPEHIWDRTDKQGASLKAFETLGDKLGYQLVGENGANAFFVRKDLAKNLFPMPATAEHLYRRSWLGHRNVRYIGN